MFYCVKNNVKIFININRPITNCYLLIVLFMKTEHYIYMLIYFQSFLSIFTYIKISTEKSLMKSVKITTADFLMHKNLKKTIKKK